MVLHEIRCKDCGTRNRVPLVSSGRPRCGQCHQDLPWLANVDAELFDPVISRSSMPVLVDLWAPWCGPCLMVAPVLEQLASEHAGALRIAKVNVDENPEISARFGVQGIPTMLLFHHGKEISRQTGALPLASLRRWVDSALVSEASTQG